jgi:hypothetical protein
MPLAPGRFSTTICCPQRAASRVASVRAMMSGPVPGE